jgi:uroporphyrinogen decarboxylase
VTSRRERVEAAIAGGVADRLPVALWRHFPGDDQDPASLAESTLAFQREFDFDLIKVTPASSFSTRGWGVEDVWRGEAEGTRQYTTRAIHIASDWRGLTPQSITEGPLAQQLESLRLVLAGADPDVPVLQTVFSPLAQAKHLAGEARLIEHLHAAPEDVLAGLETIAATTRAFVGAAAALGVAGVFYAVQHGSYRFFDDAGYARFGEPFDHRILEAADGLWCNMLHLHGEAILFHIAERLPVQIVNWHDRETPPTLREGKRRIAGAVCGGLQRWDTMVVGKPSDVHAEARQAIASLGGKGLVLGTGCVVPVVAPRSNLLAARQAVES